MHSKYLFIVLSIADCPFNDVDISLQSEDRSRYESYKEELESLFLNAFVVVW
jgi:hypothetical protein